MTIKIAFKEVALSAENLRLAEEELDLNSLGLEEGQIVEERKTLRWLKDGAHTELDVVEEEVGEVEQVGHVGHVVDLQPIRPRL